MWELLVEFIFYVLFLSDNNTTFGRIFRGIFWGSLFTFGIIYFVIK